MRDREQLSALIKEFRTKDSQESEDASNFRVPKMLQGLVGGDLRGRLKDTQPVFDDDRIVDPYRSPGTVADFLEAVNESDSAILEIGSQRGYFAIGRAIQTPKIPMLASEVRRSDCRLLLKRRKREEATNLFLMVGDVRLQLLPLLEAGPVFHEVYILFPDPWWKKKHHKRRLFKEGFLDFLSHVVVPGGKVILKTDVEGYKDEVLALLSECATFDVASEFLSESWFTNLPQSRRERELVNAGLPIFPIVMKRNNQETKTELFESPEN
jgi:tRNA (guanine-N7-)-methyltransferase